jgi:hypothetical protein
VVLASFGYSWHGGECRRGYQVRRLGEQALELEPGRLQRDAQVGGDLAELRPQKEQVGYAGLGRGEPAECAKDLAAQPVRSRRLGEMNLLMGLVARRAVNNVLCRTATAVAANVTTAR